MDVETERSLESHRGLPRRVPASFASPSESIGQVRREVTLAHWTVQQPVQIVLSIFFCSPKRKWTKRKGRPAKMVPTAPFSLGVGNVPSPNAERRFFKVPPTFPLPRKKSPQRVDNPTIRFAPADGTPFSKGVPKYSRSAPILRLTIDTQALEIDGGAGRQPYPVGFDFGQLHGRLSISNILHGRNHRHVGGCLNTRVSAPEAHPPRAEISTSFLWYLSLDEQRKEQQSNRFEQCRNV